MEKNIYHFQLKSVQSDFFKAIELKYFSTDHKNVWFSMQKKSVSLPVSAASFISMHKYPPKPDFTPLYKNVQV